MITLRQLRYLASLARHRHFGRAADDCAVTQPALSMQIQTGLEVAERAARILAATQDLVDFARHRDVLTGELRLGIIPTLAPYVLPRVLPRLQSGYPHLHLDVRETLTKVLMSELVAGNLDVVLLA